MALLGILAALSFPAWRGLLDSGARRTGEARVMDVLEHARGEAVSSGRDVWVVLRHDGGGGADADRIVARDGANFVPLGGWDRLPRGITFRTGAAAVPDAVPARNPGDRGRSAGRKRYPRGGYVPSIRKHRLAEARCLQPLHPA